MVALFVLHFSEVVIGWSIKWRVPGQEVDQKTWREIVEKDCRARGLNTEDVMCRSRWRKLIGMIDDHDECSG